MMNPIRSERGWWDRRRIVVLVSVVAAFGVFSLGSAGTASATFTACKGSVAPKSKGNPGKAANLSFSCSNEIRAYGIVSNKALTSFSNPPLVSGAPVSFLQCSTAAGSSGFGCGVTNRAAPGTQTNPSTGSTTTCGRSSTVLAAGPGGQPPAVSGITGPPCTQVIPAGAVFAQDVTLAANPCNFKPKDPLQMSVVVGGEPPISSFTVRGDSTTVGEYASEPFKLKLKGYSGCQPEAVKGKKASSAGARTAATGGVPINPLGCFGSVSPKVPGKPDVDAKYSFECTANIRTYAIVTNKPIDLVGGEGEVSGPGANSSPCVSPPGKTITAQQCAEGESASHQCEGPIPYIGFGCGFPDRQAATSATNNYGRRLSAGNILTGEIGFPQSPCKREPGTPKLKVWVLAMNEPTIQPPASGGSGPTVGEFLSEPFQLALTGYSKGACTSPRRRSRASHQAKPLLETAAAPVGAAAVLVLGAVRSGFPCS